MGYKFQKMYASNYNCWHKSVAEYSSETIWIWKKGKEVEFKDLFRLSYLLINELVINNRLGTRYTNNDCGHFILDLQENKLLDYKFELTDIYLYNNNYEPTKEELNAYYKRYRSLSISDDFVLIIKELFDKKMIEIVDEE